MADICLAASSWAAVTEVLLAVGLLYVCMEEGPTTAGLCLRVAASLRQQCLLWGVYWCLSVQVH